MKLHEKIKQRRKELGLSVEELANIIGKNRATVYRYESNQIKKIPITILKPIANALKVTPNYLLGGVKMNKRLKKARLNANLTLLNVAEKLNLSEATIQRYESGNIKNIKYETLLVLAELYNVSPTYLLGWEDSRQIGYTENMKYRMEATEYQELANRTVNFEVDNLLNGALGLCSEAGEVADLIKKHKFQGHKLDNEKLLSELGDICWHVALLISQIDVDFGKILINNIEKLKNCYPKEFDSDRSVNRNERY